MTVRKGRLSGYGDLGDPQQVERLRERVAGVVAEAEGDALLVAERVLVAMGEPAEPAILLDTATTLLEIAGRAAVEQDRELMDLRRRLDELQRSTTH